MALNWFWQIFNRESGREQEWYGEFYLHAFLSLILADSEIERREVIWIKRFFQNENLPNYFDEFQEQAYHNGEYDRDKFERLLDSTRDSLATRDKRRFIYNLAQMCKSKGQIKDVEYEQILYISERIGIEDTDADSMITSVFSVNESFMAIVGVLALGVMLYFTKVVIIPLIIAIFITMIVHKVEVVVGRYLPSRGMIWFNKFLSMVFIFGVVFVLILAAFQSGKQIADRLPHYQKKGVALLKEVPYLRSDEGDLRREAILDRFKRLPIASTVGGVFESLVDILSDFLLVIVFTGFLSFSRLSFQGTMEEMADKISGYIVVKTFVSLLTGGTAYLLCVSFGIDFALFWFVLAFLFNYIPSIGSVMATVPPILLSMIQLQDWSMILLFAFSFVVVQFIYGNVLEPKLMGDKLDVNPVALLLGLIFWGFLWGLPGMFLAAPLMALIRLLSSYYNFSRKFEKLLAA